jgi:dienelactone hydrolase
MKKTLLISLLLLASFTLASHAVRSQTLATSYARTPDAMMQDKGVIKIDCTNQMALKLSPKKVSFPGPTGQTLYGWLYVPQGAGPFPAVVWNHGSGLMDGQTEQEMREDTLARFYVGNGYAFFTPHRTGHGLSKGAGQSTVDEEKANCVGADAAQCKVEYHEKANLDTAAAISWLKEQPNVERKRIVASGVSYGGIQTLLSAEKGHGLSAFVTFSPASMSWANGKLRQRLLTAIENAVPPIFLIQAKGDYTTEPYELLGDALKAKRGLNRAKLYPKFGNTEKQAHHKFAVHCGGIEIWGGDVLTFLEAAMSEAGTIRPSSPAASDQKPRKGKRK